MPAKKTYPLTFNKLLSRRSLKLVGWLLGVVAVMSMLAVMLTVIGESQTSGPIYLALVNINLIFALALIFFMGRRVILLFLERRRGLIGTRLHIRLLGIFTVLAVLPSIMVSIFSIFLLNQGIESWFSSRVTAALDGSLQVAQAYLDENEKLLFSEAQTVANAPAVRAPTFLIDPEAMQEEMRRIREELRLADVAIYDSTGALVAHAGDVGSITSSSELVEFFNGPRAMDGGIIKNLEERRLVAITPITEHTFLVLTKWIDASVLARVDQTHEAYKEYYELRSERDIVRLIFTLFLVLLTASTMAGAIWAGLSLASKIVKPVTHLVHATNKVSAGDLDVRVTPKDDDEIGILTQAFNRMASQLKENRELLERKNTELNERRRMTEAVLTGVSAGVMSVDDTGKVLLANKTAREVLDVKVGRRIEEFSEELQRYLDHFVEGKGIALVQEKIRVASEEGARTLLVRMVPQQSAQGKVKSVVVTFDDITELLTAQKVGAWADVARRIAHEIKNPLTPIQLSAERLKRKYLKAIPEADQELYGQLTDTIVRRTEDMRAMVNEFSDFARMPRAVMQEENIVPILQDILILQREARPDIQFETVFPKGNKAVIMCDASHISRVFTNVIENAVNAIEEGPKNRQKSDTSFVKLVVEMSQAGTLVATVTDNGKGLPEDMETDTLFDPYVTTRKKGTGLGLAIVRRVMDEHGGQIKLMRRDEGGTIVEMIFPTKKLEG